MPTRANLAIRATDKGSGVFVQGRPLSGFSVVLDFRGVQLSRAEVLRAAANGATDTFLQIDRDRFIGPSGGLDDFVNHSCDPNCGLMFTADGVCLWSLRLIEVGEELSFDYATSQQDFPFPFDCLCGSPACRGWIGDFSLLPLEAKEKYQTLNVVAPYLLTGEVPGQSSEADPLLSGTD